MTTSRFPGFHQLSRAARLEAVARFAGLSPEDAQALGRPDPLELELAERVSENVIGVYPLPLGVAVNFRVNGRDRLVPMAIEEPSVVAAASNAARLLREGDLGIRVEVDPPIALGQVQVVGLADPAAAASRLGDAERAQIVRVANEGHDRLLAAGGGARRVTTAVFPETPAGPFLVLYLEVHVADAMGANAVNSMCEKVAPLVERLTGGRVRLRILSNHATLRRVRAAGFVPPGALEPDVVQGIFEASALAEVDIHRAVTHNKGIANGVDALLVATGNDWRAVEAASHAWASTQGVSTQGVSTQGVSTLGSGRPYGPLATWRPTPEGGLAGRLEMPMPVGIVGGATRSLPQARRALAIAGVRTAADLAELAGAVGLAQNLAALRALAAEGIQRGHMELVARHSRHGASSGAASGIEPTFEARAMGKAILLGEHAVVYGEPAISVPLAALETRVSIRLAADAGGRAIVVDRRGLDTELAGRMFHRALELLGMEARGPYEVHLDGNLAVGAGMGSSAALAVALLRALAKMGGHECDLEALLAHATALEKLAHGSPSGIDPATVAFERPIYFRKGTPPVPLDRAPAPGLVLALVDRPQSTSQIVADVRRRYETDPLTVGSLVQGIGRLVERGRTALERADWPELGRVMNENHARLAELGVSSSELDRVVSAARDAGALGAKLSGAGRGGLVLALVSSNAESARTEVARALERAGARRVFS